MAGTFRGAYGRHLHVQGGALSVPLLGNNVVVARNVDKFVNFCQLPLKLCALES